MTIARNLGRACRYSPGLAALGVLALPGGAEATVFGLGVDNVNSFANSYGNESGASCGGTALNSLFENLTSRCGHPVQAVSLPVPWDAFGHYDSGSQSCVLTTTQQGTTQAGQDVRVAEYFANADQLGFSLTVGRGPAVNGDNGVPSESDYDCGISGLLTQLNIDGIGGVGIQVYNEPDHDMSAAAAALLYRDAHLYEAVEGGRHDMLLAGAFSDNDDPFGGSYGQYIENYVVNLEQVEADWPPYWSFHPYDDTSRDYAGNVAPQQMNDTISYINAVSEQPAYGVTPNYWITETAGRLVDGTQVSSCSGSPYPDGTLGGCLNGYPAGQKNAANYGFLNLPSETNGYASQIQRMYWYEFETSSDASTGWDSGLLDAAGAPRDSYCELTNTFSYPTCGSNAVAMRFSTATS